MENSDVRNNRRKKLEDWVRFTLRLGITTALHPFEYSKVLIQLGYEPIPARPGRSLFGRQIMVLPNIFQYAGYIKRVDGFFGCYRGITPKIIGTIIGSAFSEKIADKLGLLEEKEDWEIKEPTEEEEYENFQKQLKKDIVIHFTGIVITHPFHVISIRMMAQFIGRESNYSSIFGSIAEIYKNEGILGFFSGLFPKIIGDLACLVLTSSTVYLVNKYFIKEKDSREYFGSFTQFVYASLLYPLQVVTTCMCVSGSELSAAKPPIMLGYNNWVDCWSDLQLRGELKRGSSLFWRSVPVGKSTAKYNYAPLPVLSKYS